MRIPASVIVMSLVTAVPFALAVRDTVKPHAKTLDEMSDSEREMHFEEEMRKEAADTAQREAAEAAKRIAAWKTLFGDKPAQLGSYFAQIHLGMPGDDAAINALESADHQVMPYIEYTRSATLDRITIPGEDHCDTLHDLMVKAWSDSVDGVYLDPASHQRAMYQDCAITFDRYVEVNQWIDKKGDAPITLAMLGMSADKLRDQLGARLASDDGDVLMWSAPGLGRSNGPTSITARIDNDKVIGMSINVTTDSDTIDAVKARLAGLLGKGTVDDGTDPDSTVWKGKIPATLTASEGTISLDLGK